MPELDLELEALNLAQTGMKVFPLDDEKKPRTPNGFHDATSNAQDILKWDWNSAGAIGAAIPDGTFVIDIDPRNSGDSTAETLRNAGLYMPSTRVHRTRGGGTHRFYKLPLDRTECRLRGRLGPGIDVKAAGKGYVVVPPSPGYSVAFDRDPAIAPEWMISELVKESTNGNGNGSLPTTQKYFDMFQSGTEYGMAALEKEIGRLLLTGEGDRNNALNKAAFSLAQLTAGGELSAEETISKLHLAGERMGLPEDEVAATVLSGWESGSELPRVAPEKNYQNSTQDDFSTPPPSEDDPFWTPWFGVESTPPPFYLWPFVPKKAFVLSYGHTESSKSIVLMALAGEGSKKGLRTSLYSLENSAHVDSDRARRLDPNPEHFRFTNMPLDLNDPQQVNNLIEREQDRPGGPTDWVIIDSYSLVFNTRTDDENRKAVEFARRIRYIMHQVGCSVLVVDHLGFSDHGQPRGASAKMQMIDVGLKFEKVGKWVPGEPSRFSIEVTKSARYSNTGFVRGRLVDLKDRGLELKWDSGYEDIVEWKI